MHSTLRNWNPQLRNRFAIAEYLRKCGTRTPSPLLPMSQHSFAIEILNCGITSQLRNTFANAEPERRQRCSLWARLASQLKTSIAEYLRKCGIRFANAGYGQLQRCSQWAHTSSQLKTSIAEYLRKCGIRTEAYLFNRCPNVRTSARIQSQLFNSDCGWPCSRFYSPLAACSARGRLPGFARSEHFALIKAILWLKFMLQYTKTTGN
jgi:hypothetical protein